MVVGPGAGVGWWVVVVGAGGGGGGGVVGGGGRGGGDSWGWRTGRSSGGGGGGDGELEAEVVRGWGGAEKHFLEPITYQGTMHVVKIVHFCLHQLSAIIQAASMSTISN